MGADRGDLDAQSCVDRQPEESWRVDRDTGVREEVGFFGPGASLFGCRHVPSDGPVGGLVVCSPLHAEFQTNYRREVALARALAALGVLVQRFHYRGTGNSYGGSEEITFSSLVEDALTAAEHAAGGAGLERMAFLGTRMGALVAAAASRDTDAALLLWEPTNDPSRYFREMFRASAMRQLKSSDGSPPSAGSTIERLQDGTAVDVLGYTIDPRLYASVREERIDTYIGDRPRAALMIQLGRGQDLAPEHRVLAEAMSASGWSVTSQVVEASESWWFVNDPTLTAGFSKTVVDLTVDWLAPRFAREDAA